mmetsp:Transcript_8619/g.27748  ORF Transcript_8619/g.27748 Transcript_8619/m.27748 type:complete len:266 (-) Transcript_8619:870-1667(-)
MLYAIRLARTPGCRGQVATTKPDRSACAVSRSMLVSVTVAGSKRLCPRRPASLYPDEAPATACDKASHVSRPAEKPANGRMEDERLPCRLPHARHATPRTASCKGVCPGRSTTPSATSLAHRRGDQCRAAERASANTPTVTAQRGPAVLSNNAGSFSPHQCPSPHASRSGTTTTATCAAERWMRASGPSRQACATTASRWRLRPAECATSRFRRSPSTSSNCLARRSAVDDKHREEHAPAAVKPRTCRLSMILCNGMGWPSALAL